MKRSQLALLLSIFVCFSALDGNAQRGTLVVADPWFDGVVRFDARTGILIDVISPIVAGHRVLGCPGDVIFGPDRNFYITDRCEPFDPVSRERGSVVKFDGTTGAYVGIFASGNGMRGPVGVAFGPDGDLYVSDVVNPSGGAGAVLRFNGKTGVFIDSFVTSGGELIDPSGIAFGPDDNLYVASEDLVGSGHVLRYDGKTGAFLGVFATASGLPRFISFGPDGNLYLSIVTLKDGQVFQFNGQTGALMRTFVPTASGNLDAPTGLAFGPDNDLYISSDNAGRALDCRRGNQHGILRFTGPTKPGAGDFINVFVDTNDVDFASDLLGGLAFSPPVGCEVNTSVLGYLRVLHQSSQNTCWATSTTIMRAWREGHDLDEKTITKGADKVAPQLHGIDSYHFHLIHDEGLIQPEWNDFLTRQALQQKFIRTPGADVPTVCELNSLLQTGPILVVTSFDLPSISPHAEVLIGIQGDGSDIGTTVRIIDPGDGQIHEESYQSLIVSIRAVSASWPQWVQF